MNKKLFTLTSSLLTMILLLMLSACQHPHNLEIRPQSALVPKGDLYAVREEMRKLIQKILDEDMTPGISLALVDRNGPIWLEGFGQADSQKGIPTSPDTVYRVGSLSKPLTAMAIMQLSAQDIIALDDPLQDQLPDFNILRHQQNQAEITPRQLLSHRSGLPSDLQKGMYTPTSFREITHLLHDEYAAYAPDVVYSYSNLGYDLLGNLIEKQTNMLFSDYMRRELFEPLSMHNTGFSLTPAMHSLLAAGHEDGHPHESPPLRDTPALGLYSNSRDLANLMVALLQQEVPGLDEDAFREIWTPQTVKDQISLGFSPSLGWFIENDAELGRVVRHGGSTLLYGAELALLPDQGLAVVVLANGADTNRVSRQLAAAILKFTIQLQGRQPSETLFTTDNITEHGDPMTPGGYATDLGLLIMDPEHPRLCACIIERILDLVRFDDGSYELTAESAASLPDSYRVLGELRFHTRHIGGKDVLLANSNDEEIVLGNRIESHVWEKEWRQRLGSYKTLNPDGDYTVQDLRLSIEAGVLCLHYRVPHLDEKTIRVPLKPISAKEAVIEGLGRGRGETIRVVNRNGKQCLRFSGYLVELLESEK